MAHQRGNVDAAFTVHRDPPRRLLDRELCEELALAGKLLHAVVSEFANEDFILGIDGYANGRMQFAGFVALFAPLKEEMNRWFLRPGAERTQSEERPAPDHAEHDEADLENRSSRHHRPLRRLTQRSLH